MRRLLSRNHGALPPATLIRIWREILAATTALQGAMTVAVCAPPEVPGLWDIARDHYGSSTPMLAYGSPGQVIRAVIDGQAVVGVLPMPEEAEPDPWWRHLLSTREDAPHVIARLPFAGRGNARSGPDALVIGRGTQQQTGSDRTLLVTENASDISRGRLFSSLSGVGLACTFMAACEHPEATYTLIEIDGFVPPSDPRLERFRTQLGTALHRLLRFGGYAVPLPAAALSPPRAPTAAAAAAVSASAAKS
jgi:hypothetical protein